MDSESLKNSENNNEKKKEKDLKKSIKIALAKKEKVEESEKEENKKCGCGGIFYKGTYNLKSIIVCNKCHRIKLYKSSLKDTANNNNNNNNPKKIIFKDIQTENNKIYKKPLVKLGIDLSKSMVKENSPYKQLTRNKINLLNSAQDLTFRSLLKSYYNNSLTQEKKYEEENEKSINELSNDLNMNEFKLLKLIGSGSYANIYLVENYKSKIQYAAKKIITDGENELEKIKMEIEIIKALKELNTEKNNFFVPIYKYCLKKLDVTSYSVFFLMPLAICDWGKEIEKKDKFYSEDFLLKILKNFSNGLSIMQYKNIAHRDIKPQNILIMKNGDYLICDFDESIFVKKAYGTFDVRGTEMYICPILQNCVYSGIKKTKINIYKSDVYSLGLCFVYAITKNFDVIKKIKKCNNDNINKNLIVNNIVGNEKFSDFFIEIIIQMIAFNEKDRLDFIQLNNLVNPK